MVFDMSGFYRYWVYNHSELSHQTVLERGYDQPFIPPKRGELGARLSNPYIMRQCYRKAPVFKGTDRFPRKQG